MEHEHGAFFLHLIPHTTMHTGFLVNAQYNQFNQVKSNLVYYKNIFKKIYIYIDIDKKK